MVAKGEGGGEGMKWEFEVSRCKPSCIEGVNNKVLCIAQETISHTLQ